MQSKVWSSILLVQEHLKKQKLPLFIDVGSSTVIDDPVTAGELLIVSDSSEERFGKEIIWKSIGSELVFGINPRTKLYDHLQFLCLYLPFTIINQTAEKMGRPYTVAHFAQTLDGRIATESGISKWIGNSENLEHAHRMRALFDAVLVGGNTYKQDNPKLNVRHVKGPDPRKIVIGDLLEREREDVLYIHSLNDSHKSNGTITLSRTDNCIKCEEVLHQLFLKGIRSVYIEGGSITSSYFLEAGLLDKIQLHIAPKIFGSGINSFQLPSIDHVDKAVTFKEHNFYQIGDEIMFSGDL